MSSYSSCFRLTDDPGHRLDCVPIIDAIDSPAEASDLGDRAKETETDAHTRACVSFPVDFIVLCFLESKLLLRLLKVGLDLRTRLGIQISLGIVSQCLI